MPFVNSFCITCESEPDAQLCYIVAYALWKAGQFKPFINGSVVPFIHLDDAKKVITGTFSVAKEDPFFMHTVKKALDIERLEIVQKQQLAKLGMFKTALLMHHLRVA